MNILRFMFEDGYEDISSVVLRFDKQLSARSSEYPYTRGPQMKCVGEYCKRKLHAAVCFAESELLHVSLILLTCESSSAHILRQDEFSAYVIEHCFSLHLIHLYVLA